MGLFDIESIDNNINKYAEHWWVQPLMNRFPIFSINKYDAPIEELCSEIRSRYPLYRGVRNLEEVKKLSLYFFLVQKNNQKAALISIPTNDRYCELIKWDAKTWTYMDRFLQYTDNSLKTLRASLHNGIDWFVVDGEVFDYFKNACLSDSYRFYKNTPV